MGNVVRPMWAECPAVTRTVLAGYPAMGLFLVILRAAAGVQVGLAFECSLWTVVSRLHLWTLLVSGFYHQFAGGMSFLMLLLELYMGMMYFPRREKELGSLAFALWLLIANMAVNVIFLVMMGAVCVFWDVRYYVAGNSGLWPLIIVLMSLQLLADPEGSTNFWGLVQIPNKWYPLFFVGVFSLLNALVLWNFFAAVAVGYAAFVRPGLRLDRLLPGQARIQAAEQKCCSQRREVLGGAWISASGAWGAPAAPGGGGGGGGLGPQVWGLQMQARSSEASSSGGGKFTVFSGRGNRLGDGGGGDDAPAPAKDGGAGPPSAARATAPAQDEERGEASRLVTEEGGAASAGAV